MMPPFILAYRRPVIIYSASSDLPPRQDVYPDCPSRIASIRVTSPQKLGCRGGTSVAILSEYEKRAPIWVERGVVPAMRITSIGTRPTPACVRLLSSKQER